METAQDQLAVKEAPMKSAKKRRRPGTGRLRVLKIQRSCFHDGPGVRTTLFFRGCGLRCLWCQNPEALSITPDIVHDENYSIADVMEVISRDREYYKTTHGGVTLSGGDPLLQDLESLIRLLSLIKEEGIHVSAETALHVPWENVEKVAPYVDLFIVDLKAMGDEGLHRKCTGQGSRLIHSNIKKLVALKANIKYRMVIVPGINDMPECIEATAEFLKSVGYGSFELLKYHNMYEDKARSLNIERAALNISPEQSSAAVARAVELFSSHGIKAEYLDDASYRNQAEFSPRVHEIRDAIRESDYHLCLEASRLKTKFYKQNGFKKPAHIHRAKRLAYVLANKKKIIYPKELLVGNFTAKRVGAQIWEEHYGTLIGVILHQIDRQTPVAFKISLKDKLTFYSEIMPFWLKHSIVSRVNRSFPFLVKNIARLSDLSTGFNNNMASIAHFIVNSERLLENGTSGLIAEIEAKRKEKPENNQDFYDAAIIALKALEDFAEGYAIELSKQSRNEKDPLRRKELAEMAEICRRVPKNPARTYHEALQSMLLLQIALCTETFENAISFGRLDQILNPYYERDRKAGRITYEQAKELLALFILKMDEAVLVNDGDTYLRIGRLFETQSTDQTVTAGGMGKDGKDATNDLTYMLLDICELQPLAVNMTARIHPESPKKYLDRIAEVYINGAPMPALYNDEVYVESLQKHYPQTTVEQSRNYAIVGCVEPNANDDHFGNTDCANINVTLPFLQALKGEEDDLWNFGVPEQMDKIIGKFVDHNFKKDHRLSKLALSQYTKARERLQPKKASYCPPRSMDELLERYQRRLNCLAAGILADHQKIERVVARHFPTPLSSTLFPGCIESGKDVNEGGASINSAGIQGVGITDVGDSLNAIDEVVFQKKLYTMEDVLLAMDANFDGTYYQAIHRALLDVPKFGNDCSRKAVDWVNKSLEIFCNALKAVENCPRDGIYTAGYYALNVNIIYGLKTPALPSGRLKGAPLANSVAPHYGMEMADLMSSLNSVAGVDFADYAPNGTTVTFTIDSGLFQGPDGVGNLAGIISTYFKKGGMQFQPNVINREILLDAYHNPEKYPYLMVRVAGYCSYFNNISDELKLAIINRTCYH